MWVYTVRFDNFVLLWPAWSAYILLARYLTMNAGLWWSHLLSKLSWLIHWWVTAISYHFLLDIYCWNFVIKYYFDWCLLITLQAPRAHQSPDWLTHGEHPANLVQSIVVVLEALLGFNWLVHMAQDCFPKRHGQQPFKWNLYLSYYCCSGWLL